MTIMTKLFLLSFMALQGNCDTFSIRERRDSPPGMSMTPGMSMSSSVHTGSPTYVQLYDNITYMYTEMPTEMPTETPTEMPTEILENTADFSKQESSNNDKSLSLNTTIGIGVGSVCVIMLLLLMLYTNRNTIKETSTKPFSPGTFFNKEALNNPVYDDNNTEENEDNGYIDSDTYEEPVMNTDSLKQRNLYDLTIDSTYNDINTAEILYDMAYQEPENLYDLGSNNNEVYDNNINENN